MKLVSIRSSLLFRGLIGLAGIYVLLAQLATTSDELHRWMHAEAGVVSDCGECHSPAEPGGTHSDSTDSDHRCLITLLASGALFVLLGLLILPKARPTLDFSIQWIGKCIEQSFRQHAHVRAPPIVVS